MKLLTWLIEAFFTIFGITRPKPNQQRRTQIVIGGFLLVFLFLIASLVTDSAVGLHARPH